MTWPHICEQRGRIHPGGWIYDSTYAAYRAAQPCMPPHPIRRLLHYFKVFLLLGDFWLTGDSGCNPEAFTEINRLREGQGSVWAGPNCAGPCIHSSRPCSCLIKAAK